MLANKFQCVAEIGCWRGQVSELGLEWGEHKGQKLTCGLMKWARWAQGLKVWCRCWNCWRTQLLVSVCGGLYSVMFVCCRIRNEFERELIVRDINGWNWLCLYMQSSMLISHYCSDCCICWQFEFCLNQWLHAYYLYQWRFSIRGFLLNLRSAK